MSKNRNNNTSILSGVKDFYFLDLASKDFSSSYSEPFEKL